MRRFGVREITNVVMKAKSAMRLSNKVYYKNEPVLYFDSLKTSSLESAATTVYAQGGRGNSRLIAWEGEKTLTFNMEDALLSPESFAVLSGAGLIENKKINNKENIIVPIGGTENGFAYPDTNLSVQRDDLKMTGISEELGTFYLFNTDSVKYQLPGNTLLKSLKVNILNTEKEKLFQFFEKHSSSYSDRYIEYLSNDQNWGEYQNFIEQIISQNALKLFVYNSNDEYIMHTNNFGDVVKNNVKLPEDGKIIIKYGWGADEQSQNDAAAQWLNPAVEWPFIIPIISYEIDESELITGYEHIVEKVEIKKDEKGNYYTKITKDAPYQTLRTVSLINPKNFLKKGAFTTSADYIQANEKISLSDPEVYDGDIWIGEAIADYYTPIYNKTAKQLTIDPDKFGGNFYLEADTLFRDIYGADHAATFIIPNCKVQSNFTFTMASSGDPSTFNFVLDAFPGYTRFDPSKKVLACLQVNEKGIYEEGLEDRAGTPWAPGAGLYN